MFERHLKEKILNIEKQYRCITIVGPRQSGKTTLCRNLFPNYQYFSFESPDILDIFDSDPRGFLNGVKQNAIFDEVQKVPKLLSYLQEILDDKKDSRKFILTGSNNLNLSNKVSQTLAGRTTILQLLPLQRDEIPGNHQQKTLEASIFYGGYPRIYDETLDPTDWLGSYFQTYVERDVRDTINIVDLNRFNQFIRLLGGRVGQLMSFFSLGNEAGVTQPTAKSWFSALASTYICFSLEPHFKNFNKRMTKAPKVYFYDTGLLCYLLRITNSEQLSVHPFKGQIFENWVIAEYMKYFLNKGKEAPLYFWRDQHGHEIDLVIDQGTHLELIEIKSGQTFQKDFVKNIGWLNKLQNRSGGKCVYGGSKKYTLQGIDIEPWNQISFGSGEL